jgi:preprotein translocase subunit SecG
MEQIILIVHVLAALAIIGLILIQQGKGADMGASFGAGASQTLLGSTGSGSALTRATAVFATIFFATSLSLAYVAKQKSGISEDVIEVPELQESRDVAPVMNESKAPDSDMPASETDASPKSGSSSESEIPSA